MSEYLNFMIDTLVPAGNEVLRRVYKDYGDGKDIDVQTKDDHSPASAADREAEKAIRGLINEAYPDHGIWGEEYGTENLDREYVWVLDPLDGTREFLAQKPGKFGLLIGILKDGKPFSGVISDPLELKNWSGEIQSVGSQRGDCALGDCVVACTNPDGMFYTKGRGEQFDAFKSDVAEIRTELNCMGFVALIDGGVDAVVEHDLGLHDIVALIPALDAAGVSIIDFEGTSYRDMVFDLQGDVGRKYAMIAAGSAGIAQEILGYFKDID